MLLKKLWNSQSQDDWLSAEKEYWVKITNNHLEQDIEHLDPARIKAMDVEQFYDWLWDKYFVWKFTQPNRLKTSRDCKKTCLATYKRNNEMDELQLIHNKLFCFDLDDIAAGLKIASSIHGLATAGASGLLAILFPSYFGTVDQWVVKGLQTLPEYATDKVLYNMNPDNLRPTQGVYLIQQMRDKAKALNEQFGTTDWTPRRVDKILWTLRND